MDNTDENTSTKYNQSIPSDNGNDSDEKPRHKHVKPVNFSHDLN